MIYFFSQKKGTNFRKVGQKKSEKMEYKKKIPYKWFQKSEKNGT